MKYILKENIGSHKLTAIDQKLKKDLLDGKKVALEVMPRCLIGKVVEAEEKPKKTIKKEND